MWLTNTKSNVRKKMCEREEKTSREMKKKEFINKERNRLQVIMQTVKIRIWEGIGKEISSLTEKKIPRQKHNLQDRRIRTHLISHEKTIAKDEEKTA